MAPTCLWNNHLYCYMKKEVRLVLDLGFYVSGHDKNNNNLKMKYNLR